MDFFFQAMERYKYRLIILSWNVNCKKLGYKAEGALGGMGYVSASN
jgi:hypothetical protein